VIPEPIDIALRVATILDRHKVPHFVGGSLASSIVGEPRATDDIDIAAKIGTQHISALVADLKREFYVDETTVREAVRRNSSFNIIHTEKVIKVDLFCLGDRPFDREQLVRSANIKIADEPPEYLRVASAEDITLQKLLWYEKGGRTSDRQWRDILGVLKVQANRLDRKYLDRWASELDVSDLLSRACAEAGEG